MKHEKMLKAYRNSKFGRFVTRLLGEESGQAMMEYVVIAVLIVAAVAIGAWLFGAQILRMFGIAGDAAGGDIDRAQENIAAQQAQKPGQDEAALNTNKSFPVAEDEENTINVGNNQ